MKHYPIEQTPYTKPDHHDWLRQENIGLRQQLRRERELRRKAEDELWRSSHEVRENHDV